MVDIVSTYDWLCTCNMRDLTFYLANTPPLLVPRLDVHIIHAQNVNSESKYYDTWIDHFKIGTNFSFASYNYTIALQKVMMQQQLSKPLWFYSQMQVLLGERLAALNQVSNPPIM